MSNNIVTMNANDLVIITGRGGNMSTGPMGSLTALTAINTGWWSGYQIVMPTWTYSGGWTTTGITVWEVEGVSYKAAEGAVAATTIPVIQ